MGLKICVIGCGGMANAGHGPAYVRYKKARPNMCLAACCDIDELKARTFADEFGFERTYTNYAKMLHEIQPDAICLLVNVEYLFPIAMDILPLGIPLFLEKPPGLSAEQTRQMAAAAEKSGAINAVGFNRRFTPLLVRFKTLFDALDGEKFLRYDMFRVSRADPDFATTAIHAIDAVRYICGADYAEIAMDYQPMPDLGSTVVNMTLNAKMSNGVRAQLTIAPVTGLLVERAMGFGRDQAVLVHTPIVNSLDDAGGIWEYEKNRLKRFEDGVTCPGIGENDLVAGFYGENAAFLDAVSSRTYCENDLKNAVQSVEVADCLRKRMAQYP